MAINTCKDGHKRIFVTMVVVFGRDDLINAILVANRNYSGDKMKTPKTRAAAIRMAKDNYNTIGQNEIISEVVDEEVLDFAPEFASIIDNLFPELI